MSGKGELTTLLTKKPMESKEIFMYARTNNIQLNELFDLQKFFSELDVGDSKPHLFLLACSSSKPDIVSALVKEGWSIHKYIKEYMSTPLMTALETGNIPVAKLLIDMGVDFKSMIPCGFTPIAAALQDEQNEEKACLKGVKLLLRAGVSINAVVAKDDQKKALHLAVCNNLPLVVDFLLKNGADGNALDKSKYTPLHIAVYNSDLNIIELLMKHKVELYIENIWGETPILLAMSCSNKQAIATLVKGGYDVNRAINSEEYFSFSPAPLHLAVEQSQLDMVKLLVSLGADVNKKAANGCTPLYFLLNVVAGQLDPSNYMHDKLRILNFLVENGADLNVMELYMFTPLQISIQHGFLELAKAFVRLGANLNLGNQPTPLYLVTGLNHDIILLFLEFGADFNVYSPSGLTPYHIALKEKVNVNYVKSFVKFGCPYDQLCHPSLKLSKPFSFVQCKRGTQRFLRSEKQFFEGIKNNNLNLVQSAVKEGAVPTGCSEDIKYPLHFVTMNNFKDLVLFLLEHNSPPNAVNNKGETPLFIAAKQGHYDVCCVLLQFGACYNYCSKLCPKTPLKAAEEFHHTRIVRLLQNVMKMFHLARFKPIKCVKKLDKKLNNSLGNYLMSANTINTRGDTLLARTLRYRHTKIVTKMMKLRTDNF